MNGSKELEEFKCLLNQANNEERAALGKMLSMMFCLMKHDRLRRVYMKEKQNRHMKNGAYESIRENK